ncbi:enoyl-CoA hydratase [Variovorax paradoxus]|nr:enoyl-CoA hydratase [Variovorax paradoxus]
MSNDVLVHDNAGLCTISFNRLERKNSITPGMYATLAEALSKAASDPTVRVAVLQGHQTVFSAGNDLGDFANASATSTESPAFPFMRALATFPKPLLAAVCGPAVGIGTTMLLHCDMVYAGDNAVFSMPFVNLGLCPEAASSMLLPQVFGYQRAAECLLLGEPFTAQVALGLGLVNKVLPSAEVNAYAQAQATKLSAKPLNSLLEIKRLLKKGQSAAVLQQMADEGEIFKRMLMEPAAKEAFSAFREKRKPDFSRIQR